MEKILSKGLKIAIISDSYTPQKTSAAVQIRDLAHCLVALGNEVDVILPDNKIKSKSAVNKDDCVTVQRLKAPETKEVGYIIRTINEILMPFMMAYSFLTSTNKNKKFDLIVWYSPSIFHGPFIHLLKKKFNCPTYLILRDIFPEWALELGLMRRGMAYFVFKLFAKYQYLLADKIGIQTPGNMKYFDDATTERKQNIEVLQNWLGYADQQECSINLSNTFLKGRKIFAYTGNMGVAQNTDLLVELALEYRERSDIGFIFVGRGSELKRLKNIVFEKRADNIIFFEEIEPSEIPKLLSQCNFGMLSLSEKHKSHNIPGKFINYMREGLPCLALINAGNDLGAFIENFNVGTFCEKHNLNDLSKSLDELLEKTKNGEDLKSNARSAFEKNFFVEPIAKQILSHFIDE